MTTPAPGAPLVRLRVMTAADLPAVDALRALANWNQTLADWERFLTMEPAGCFVAEWQGALVGTATTTVYGRELAWIGMVLVHPDFRRRGIGRMLLDHCTAHLNGLGVRCLKLDATPLGKKIYDSLGFKDEWTLSRWECPGPNPPRSSLPLSAEIRGWRESDLPAIVDLDRAAFGVRRERLLRALVQQSRKVLVVESPTGSVTGCGCLRDGSRAFYLGPVMAAAWPDAALLLPALMAGAGDEPIYWDIPEDTREAIQWAEAHGFGRQRLLTRMYLGKDRHEAAPKQERQRQFAIAGPEVG